MRKHSKNLILLALTAALASCSPSGKTDQTKITATGSSTIAPLLSEIAKRYESSHPEMRIDVQTGGSSRGINDPVKDLADIGMSSRALKDSEKEGRVTYLLASDGVAFITNSANPVTSLTDEQLRGILTGSITNWSQVGGTDAEITMVNRAEGRSELELVTDYFKIPADGFSADIISGENQHALKTVAGDANAITYISVGAAEFDIAAGTPVKMLPLRGVAASSATVGSGEFPLTRPLILITKPDPPEAIVNFVSYARSLEVHDLVKQQSYVPIANE